MTTTLSDTRARDPRSRAPLHRAAILSISTALPETVVTNAEIGARVGRDPEWIEARTGIRERRVLGPDERITDLMALAATRALDRAGVAASEIDLVLIATVTADEVMPNAAPLVAHQIGATPRAGAMDLGAACSGFVNGLAIATGQIESGRARTVLLVGADALTRLIDPAERKTAIVFGDGAGAAVIGASPASPSGEQAEGSTNGLPETGIGPIVLGSDAERSDMFVAPHGGTITMDGRETTHRATAALVRVTREVLEAANVGPDQVDVFIYHQANRTILEAVGSELGLDPSRVVDCIALTGNTTAASVPLALAYAENEGRVAPGRLVFIGAVGAGLTWGGTLVRW